MKKSQIFMLTASALILMLFFLPLWEITLNAPQYPIPLGIKIYMNKLAGANEGDIKNIDLLNHYIGMQELPKEMVEFTVFPIVIVFMAIFGIIIGMVGKRKLYLVWFIIICLLGIAGMYDFYIWLYDYGHNLDSRAAIQIPGQAYQPPVFGTKNIMNFEVDSYPAIGGYILFIGIAMSALAYWWERKNENGNS